MRRIDDTQKFSMGVILAPIGVRCSFLDMHGEG